MRKIDTTQAEVTLTEGQTEIHWMRERNPKPMVRRTRVYVSGSGAFDVIEDLRNRQRVLDVLKALGYEDVKLRWSQRAGCSCGCSPGFIIEDGARHGLYDGDLWIKFNDPDVPVVDESIPARDLI